VKEYRRQSHGLAIGDQGEALTGAVAEEATRMLRRLVPFADGTPAETPVVSRLYPATSSSTGASPSNPLDTIVSAAAAVLDQETAKGVLAARAAHPSSSSAGLNPPHSVLRQVHDLIDNVARAWPASPSPTAAPAGDVPEARELPTLTPRNPLRPGQQGTLSLLICNREERSVRLTPRTTDLIGCAGGRIAADLLSFSPEHIELDPGAQCELQGRIAIPAGCQRGTYAGLLVIEGVSYLRALITVDVE
jgi:hypothetical protein